MKTTLNEIKKYHPCQSGWKTLLKSLDKTTADDAANAADAAAAAARKKQWKITEELFIKYFCDESRC